MVIFQSPNRSQISMVTGAIISLVGHGPIKLIGMILFIVAGSVWSYLEITSGVNWLRKLFGGIAALAVVYAAITLL